MTSLSTSNPSPWILHSANSFRFLLLLVPLPLIIDVDCFLEEVFSYDCILWKREVTRDWFAVSLIMHAEITWLAACKFSELHDFNSSPGGFKSPPLSSWSAGAWREGWSCSLTVSLLLDRALEWTWTYLCTISVTFVVDQYYCSLL